MSPNSIKGGAAYFENTNFTISYSTFTNNTSKSGAGIYISCQLNPIWVSAISNSSFSNNAAEISGGGIQYDSYRPTMLNLMFNGNNAQYGPDIGSWMEYWIRSYNNLCPLQYKYGES